MAVSVSKAAPLFSRRIEQGAMPRVSACGGHRARSVHSVHNLRLTKCVDLVGLGHHGDFGCTCSHGEADCARFG